MMIQQHASASTGMDHKKEQLHVVYEVYSHWVQGFPLACQKGCAACCTQSVTMTSLEGEDILDFTQRAGTEKWLAERLGQAASGKSRGAITTNQYAGACLEHREIDGDTLGNWDFTPCVFLEKNICSIYEVRPFGCRSFGSFVRCSENSGAEIAPIHLTVNTVFSQIIEHICSDGGCLGNMADILENLLEDEALDTTGKLLPAQSIPGFLLEAQEAKVIHILLKQLCEQSAEKQTFGDLIDNFMPIL
jgi:Fe-S-cluster containining protein